MTDEPKIGPVHSFGWLKIGGNYFFDLYEDCDGGVHLAPRDHPFCVVQHSGQKPHLLRMKTKADLAKDNDE